MPRKQRTTGPAVQPKTCCWLDLRTALRHFAECTGLTQSQQHIKPLHWYVACRLVLEGGFRPEEIMPRPPFVTDGARGLRLSYDLTAGRGGEATILGGLKTKNVDVVVVKPGIGPVLAISCKGAVGAFRNLTNRMEEAVGDCTNLHIAYPAMVCGYLFAMRANQLSGSGQPGARVRPVLANDVALTTTGEPVESVVRFHNALQELTQRKGIRNDVSRYEAVALALVAMDAEARGQVLAGYPGAESPLRMERFFEALYRRYDERYVYSAPDLQRITTRLEWDAASPAFAALQPAADFSIRMQ